MNILIVMDPSKFLRVPGQSRPKSLIPLGRVSRASGIRPSSSVKKQQGGRSSSAQRLPVTNPLQLFVSSGRSRSCASLRDGMSTPVCRPSGRSTGTPSVTPGSAVSKYPSSNKEWVKSQHHRVQAIFSQLDPEMPPIKPLDTRTYIRSMNLLFKRLDDRIEFTDKNKGEILEYLKTFKFPCAIKPSVLKTPTVPHNFPYILSIWVWLLDTIEVIENPDIVLKHPMADPVASELFNMAVRYCATKFHLYHLPDQDDSVADKELETIYATFISDGSNLDVANAEAQENSLAEKIAASKEILASKLQRLDGVGKKVDELKTHRSETSSNLKVRAEALSKRHVGITKKMAYFQELLREQKAKQVVLKDGAANQPCSAEKLHSMKEEKETVMYSIQLKRNRQAEQIERLEKTDIALCEEKHKVQNIVSSVNSKIISECLQRPELKQLKIRETGFFQDDMIGIVEQFHHMKKEFEEKLSKQKQRANAMLHNIKKQNEQYLVIERDLHEKDEQLEEQKREATKKLEEFCKSNHELLKERDAKVKELQKIFDDMISEKPDLQELKNKDELYSKKCAQLIKERDDLMRSGAEFFTRIFGITIYAIDTHVQFQNEITQAVNDLKTATYNEQLQVYKQFNDGSEGDFK